MITIDGCVEVGEAQNITLLSSGSWPEGWKIFNFEFKRDVNDEGQNSLFIKFSIGESIQLNVESELEPGPREITDEYYISKIEWDKDNNSYHVYMYSKGK